MRSGQGACLGRGGCWGEARGSAGRGQGLGQGEGLGCARLGFGWAARTLLWARAAGAKYGEGVRRRMIGEAGEDGRGLSEGKSQTDGGQLLGDG